MTTEIEDLQFPGHLVHHVRRISANANVLIVISSD